eukprot:TRINITY_DN7107_c0_g1_i1.p1 TRINITY_DN7107_c0_g1~~TRINITY_DN7107_c0_g1_i1.p1  ORF type:complete len:1043 (-),score=331.95 TRINITY_DN7107_c0_g1_i1:27-3155(-)
MEPTSKVTLINQEAENTSKRDYIRDIETTIQQRWDQNNTFQVDAGEPDEESWMGTFPYPYMNGRLHLGHSFTLSKVEFDTGYQRMKGKKALFPFAFHCTGMPIASCAQKLEREMDEFGNPPNFPDDDDDGAVNKNMSKKLQAKTAAKRQWNIMKTIDIEEEIIPQFSDPNFWCTFFPEVVRQDLKNFGCKIDWRRSFITTDLNKFYDAFIQWQFNKLKQQDKIKFGKRYTIYSPKDNGPCMDHDRTDEGEGVGVKEYTIIKQLLVKPYPECLKHLEDDERPIYLVPATLRPETMYGQTNCFVLPEGDYLAMEVINDEIFVVSPHAARNIAHQDLTPVFGEFNTLAEFNGADLIGAGLKAPLASYDIIYVLPMMTVDPTKGTGVVTSVPSDAPADHAALTDLKNKPALREKYGIKDEWVLPFETVPIINIPEFGDTSAVTVYEQLNIVSQNQLDLLETAKDMVYLKGFDTGVMKVGKYEGQMVKVIKPIIKQELIDANQAAKYCEPEEVVISRTGDKCVVALCDQWFLDYGDEEWKAKTQKCMERLRFQDPVVEKQFNYHLNRYHEWACSRSFGLGTKLPWDPQYVIESLSDSTIYMAYYTIAHLFQKDLYGNEDNLIPFDELNHDVFEYIFADGPYTENITISKDVLDLARKEFEFFYPVDLRVSGKDLIGNHLVFFLYNHVAFFPEKFWPKRIRVNGHLLLNKKKMSKRTGNFITLEGAIKRYTADGTRFAIASAGDDIEDANFTTDNADQAIKKLWNIINWIEDICPEFPEDDEIVFETFIQKSFDAAIEATASEADKAYDEMNYQMAVNLSFFEFINLRDNYIKYSDEGGEPLNYSIIKKWTTTFVKLMAPITPHISEFLWMDVLNNTTSIVDTTFPNIELSSEIQALAAAFRSIEETLKDLRKRKQNFEKKKKNVEGITVKVFSEFPAWQADTLALLENFYTENGCFPEKKELVQLVRSNDSLKRFMGMVMGFSAEFIKNFQPGDSFNLALGYDEFELFSEIGEIVKTSLGLQNFTVEHTDETPGKSGVPGRPKIIFN